MSLDGRLQRETRFWDQRSRGRDASELEVEHEVLGREPLFRFLEQEVAAARPRRLLDAGCGAGVGTARLAGHAGHVTGIDVAGASLAAARDYTRGRELRNVDLVRTPLEALPFGDGSFDLVAGYFVLHHLEDLEAGARELARVLRPGGRALFVETWARNPLLRAGRRLAGGLGLRQGTEDEEPLGESELGTIAMPFERLELRYPSLDLFKYAHLPLLRLYRSRPEGSLVRRLVDRVWGWPVALDGLLHRRAGWLRPYGWHVVLELER